MSVIQSHYYVPPIPLVLQVHTRSQEADSGGVMRGGGRVRVHVRVQLLPLFPQGAPEGTAAAVPADHCHSVSPHAHVRA
jgi:hypothetical protein